MIYRRLLALAIALLLLGTSAFLAFGDAPVDPPQVRSLQAREAPTTTLTDFSLVVVSGDAATSLEEETELIDEATADVVATTTTTTAAPTTSAPSSAPETSSPKPTSPTTTQPAPPTTAVESGFVASAESDFASRINSLRSSNGLANLSRNGSLDSYARAWAKQMAERQKLGHSDVSSLIPPWQAVGENVGKGGSVGPIFDALAASPGHIENMLGDYTDFGIGVYRDSNGVLWTAHVFAS
jgi:uncharacterized protein YkwD